jgi:hypothetical protein
MSIRKNHKIWCAFLSRPREMIPSQYYSRACSFSKPSLVPLPKVYNKKLNNDPAGVLKSFVADTAACPFTGGVTIVERLWKEIVPSPDISEPAFKALKASMPDQHPIHRNLHIHPVTNLDHFWDRNLYWTRMMVFVKLTVDWYRK